jgi:hypothetical protein
VLVGTRERFVPFAQFPWFRHATIGELSNVTLPSPHHLYWPDLDIDLAVDSLDDPERYPLVSRTLPGRTAVPAPSRKEQRQTSGARAGGRHRAV